MICAHVRHFHLLSKQWSCELGLGLGLGFSLRAARVHTQHISLHSRNMQTPCRKRVDLISRNTGKHAVVHGLKSGSRLLTQPMSYMMAAFWGGRWATHGVYTRWTNTLWYCGGRGRFGPISLLLFLSSIWKRRGRRHVGAECDIGWRRPTISFDGSTEPSNSVIQKLHLMGFYRVLWLHCNFNEKLRWFEFSVIINLVVLRSCFWIPLLKLCRYCWVLSAFIYLFPTPNNGLQFIIWK